MRSLRSNLAWRVAISIALVLMASAFMADRVLTRILSADFDSSLLAKANTFSSLVSWQDGKIDVDWVDLPKELRPTVVDRDSDNDSVTLFDAKGKHIWGSTLIPGAVAAASPNAHKAYSGFDDDNGETYRVVIIRFQARVGGDEGHNDAIPADQNAFTLVIARDRAPLDHIIGRLRTLLALVAMLTLGSSWGAVWWAVGRGLRPLGRFGLQVAAIDVSSLNERLPLRQLPVEFIPVAEKLNGMLTRLEEVFAKERRFSADVSHELRTPIAEMRCLADVMLRQRCLSPDSQTAFGDILASARQMESLVSVLLEIVRSERDSNPLPFSDFNVGALVEKVWQAHEPLAARKHLLVTRSLPSDKIGFNDAGLIRAVIVNLVANAIEYAPAGGNCDLCVESLGQDIAIVVTNDAPDLAAHELPRLFEHFWRKDVVRGSGDHFGLGLSLAKAIAARVGADLGADLSSPGKLRMTLKLRSIVRTTPIQRPVLCLV